MVGALRDGKVPAEPHTFSPFCNFQVWGVGIKPVAGTKKECVLAETGLLAGGLPASARLPGQVGSGQAGGQVAPGRRARALALPPGAKRASAPSWCEGGDVFPPTHF